ncbi:hypothetical protein M433DRAFT_137776 [Acidomyces richmondensis BFW]|nr:hypothetical protein M433DRAFT_137776 [Acidomyces richmondensis BFW]
MVSSKSACVSAVVIIGLLQMCPAPPAIAAAIAGGVAAGVLGAAGAICDKYCPDVHTRRAFATSLLAKRGLPAGVSQADIDQCTQELNSQYNEQGLAVNIYHTSDTSVRVDNVPPACMDLATVLTGEPAQAGGPIPIPMGSSSLEYENMSVKDLEALSSALGVPY